MVAVGVASLSWQLTLAGSGAALHHRLPEHARLYTALAGNALVLSLGRCGWRSALISARARPARRRAPRGDPARVVALRASSARARRRSAGRTPSRSPRAAAPARARRPGRAVDAVGDERVVDVADRQHARGEADLVPVQAARVAAAVEPLVVVEHEPRTRGKPPRSASRRAPSSGWRLIAANSSSSARPACRGSRAARAACPCRAAARRSRGGAGVVAAGSSSPTAQASIATRRVCSSVERSFSARPTSGRARAAPRKASSAPTSSVARGRRPAGARRRPGAGRARPGCRRAAMPSELHPVAEVERRGPCPSSAAEQREPSQTQPTTTSEVGGAAGERVGAGGAQREQRRRTRGRRAAARWPARCRPRARRDGGGEEQADAPSARIKAASATWSASTGATQGAAQAGSAASASTAPPAGQRRGAGERDHAVLARR